MNRPVLRGRVFGLITTRSFPIQWQCELFSLPTSDILPNCPAAACAESSASYLHSLSFLFSLRVVLLFHKLFFSIPARACYPPRCSSQRQALLLCVCEHACSWPAHSMELARSGNKTFRRSWEEECASSFSLRENWRTPACRDRAGLPQPTSSPNGTRSSSTAAASACYGSERLELCNAAAVLLRGTLPGIGPRLVGTTSIAAVQHSGRGLRRAGPGYPHPHSCLCISWGSGTQRQYE